MHASEERSERVLELAEEFLERYRKGARPPLREYLDRHPELAAEIKEVFPAMALMENIAVADDSLGDSTGQGRKSSDVFLKQLGDFRIIREIGRGGMGVVYEAEQVSLGRHVALKLLPNHAHQDAIHKRRFEREARAAAKLHHTNIVPVFGVGDHDGEPYYVMQFIQGLGLDAVLDELHRMQRGVAPTPTGMPTAGEIRVACRDVSAVDVARSLMTGVFQESGVQPGTASPSSNGGVKRGDLTLDQPAVGDLHQQAASEVKSSSGRLSDSFTVASSSISLPGSSASGRKAIARQHSYWHSVANIGRQVAEALEYAHKQGILHRDVKPSNLLLDLRGTAWVTDFGLAKLSGPDTDNLTHTGDILGTLRYMPPESLEGKFDARGDVYSLGITLYELLAMRPAFDEKDRHKLFKQVTSGEPTALDKVRRDIPRDLVTIVQKSIEREPSRRYATAELLAADLQRFMDDEPIQARRQTQLERYWRWARHHPGIAVLGAVLTAFLVMATVASLLAAGHFNRLHQVATVARDDAVHTRNAAARQAASLLLDKGIEDARGGEPARALHMFVLALQRLPADDPESVSMERVIRANLAGWAVTVPALEHIWPEGCHYADVAYSVDGEMIAMAVAPDEVQCFRTDTGQPIGPKFKVPFEHGMLAAMVFAPDARSLWVASTSRDIAAKQWGLHRFDPTLGRPIPPTISSDGPVEHFVVTPDGQYIVGAVWGLHPENGSGAADSSRTQRWRTESIVVWETATGSVVRKEPVNAERDLGTVNTSPDTYLSLSPDAKNVTAWVQRGTNRFEGMTFTIAGNEPPIRVALPEVESDARWSLDFHNNMRTGLAIKDDKLHRWSATEPGVLGPGIPSPFRGMLRSPSADGRSVISQNEGRVFDTGAWPPRPSGVRFAHPGWQKYNLAQSPDGRFAATWEPGFEGGNRDGRLWRLPRPHSRPALPPTELGRQSERKLDFQFAGFDARGTTAALWSFYRGGAGWSERESNQSKNVRIVDVSTAAVREMSVRHAALVREVVISPDGRLYATASFDGTARVWEAATGRPAGPPLRHTNFVATVAFSPDGTTLAAGDYGPAGLVKLWDWRTGKEMRPPLRLDDIVLNVTYSPDGRYLATIKHHDWSHKPELLVWDVASAAEVFRAHFVCPGYAIRESTRFRPDGRAIAARDTSGVLRLWEMPSGKLLGERALDGDGITRWAPDGRIVAAAANLGVRLLDGDTLAPLPGGFLPLPDPITDLAFSPDGAFLLVGYTSGSAQLWDVATRKPVGPPAVLLGAIRAVTFTPDGKTCVCVAGDGTSRRWPVPTPFAETDLGRLAERVALMTGQRMDENQGLDAIAVDEWLNLRKNLVGEGSTALVPPRSDADWHNARAADAEQDRDAFGAEWHLDRLAKLRPNDWTIAARRGRVLAFNERREEAAAAYAVAQKLAPSPQVLSNWLRAAAADDEVAGRKEAALWNLNRAIALTPDDWTLYAIRSNLEDPARAVADEEVALRLGAEPSFMLSAANRWAKAKDWQRSVALLKRIPGETVMLSSHQHDLATAQLKIVDASGYRSTCSGIAARMPPAEKPVNLNAVHELAMAFTLGASATDDWSIPLSWVDRVLTRIAEREAADPSQKDRLKNLKAIFLPLRGALLFRAGQFEEAAKVLQDGMSFSAHGGGFRDRVFLALAEHRLGHAEAAKEAAAKARATPKPGSDKTWELAEIDLLLAELDAALPPGK